MSNALLILGAQSYFAVEHAEHIPSKIAAYLQDAQYDHILFSVFKNVPESNFRKMLAWSGSSLPSDTSIHPALTQYATESNVFEKTTYSALKSQPLLEYLRDHDVTSIHLCGINIDAGILATGFEAFDLGFSVTVLENICGVASVRTDYIDAAKTIIHRNLKQKKVQFGQH